MPPGPLETFVWSATLSSLAGVAWLLRSGKPVDWRSLTSAVLNSGLFGLVIALIWWEKYAVNTPGGVFFLIGISVLAGLGGVTLVDFAVQAVKAIVARNMDQNGPKKSGKA